MNEPRPFFNSRAVWIFSLVLLLSLGLAIRVYDSNDLPLEFHSTRQMLSVLKARGMYYDTLPGVSPEQRVFAIQSWKLRASIEPEIMERLVSFTYRYTGEQPWVARAYSTLFWLIGGVFLFLLARQFTTAAGALAAVAFYLFLPYAVFASRSFQPDPLMTSLIILFWWAVYEWSLESTREKDSGTASPRAWLMAILAGLFGGLAIFVKLLAAFFVISGGLGALLLGRRRLTGIWKQPQVYVMSALGILPGAAYLVYGVFVAGYLGQQFGGRFIPSYLFNPSYYAGWLNMLNLVVGGISLTFALLGLFFLDHEKRRFILALWAGYFVFGIYFNYHIASHDYYSLPLIPIAALSLAPLAGALFQQLASHAVSRWSRAFVYGILSLGLLASLWNVRNQLNAVDYRPQAEFWAEIGQAVDGHGVAGLTQDYGARMAYWGWQYITVWPTHGDLIYRDHLLGAQHDFEKRFDAVAAKKDLFLVTDFTELDLQPFLKERLMTYPIFAEGDGYVIYDINP